MLATWPTQLKVLVTLALAGLLAVSEPPAQRMRGTLSPLPAAPPPFDLVKHGTIVVREADNAYFYYRRAAARLPQKLPRGHLDFPQHLRWASVDSDFAEWIVAQREVLELWRRGTECSLAIPCQPIEANGRSVSLGKGREETLLWMALAEAMRLTDQGEPAEGWQWLRAALRYNGHWQRNGSLHEQTITASKHRLIAVAICRWADYDEVDAELLRQALADAQELEASMPPISHHLRMDYFVQRNRIRDWYRELQPYLNAPVEFRQRYRKLSRDDWLDQHSLLEQYLAVEPDFSIGLLNLHFRHLLTYVDQPWPTLQLPTGDSSQQQIARHLLMLGAPHPQLDVETFIAHALNAPLYFGLPLQRNYGPLVIRCWEHRAQHRLVSLILALQAFRRDHEVYPSTLTQLVPDYLEQVPLDPFTNNSLRYQVDERGILVWSVGANGMDQGGARDMVGGSDGVDDVALDCPPELLDWYPTPREAIGHAIINGDHVYVVQLLDQHPQLADEDLAMSAVHCAEPEVLSKILALRDDVNISGLLHVACTEVTREPREMPQILQVLLEAKADPQTRVRLRYPGQLEPAPLNRTPLHCLAERGGWEECLLMAEALIRAGAEIDAVDEDGNTPLHLAAYANPNMVHFLLEHGADPASRNRWNQRASDILRETLRDFEEEEEPAEFRRQWNEDCRIAMEKLLAAEQMLDDKPSR